MTPRLASHSSVRQALGVLFGVALTIGVAAASTSAAPTPDRAGHDRARAARLERSARFTPPVSRMDPVLSRGALERIRAAGQAAVWVVFTDKQIESERAFAAAIRDGGERLTQRARDRRAREQGGRYAPDYDDVPVVSAYVEAVAATGADVRHVSRWLNAVSVMANEKEAERLAALPFVRAIVPLRLSRRIEPVSVGPAVGPAPGSTTMPSEEQRAPSLGAERGGPSSSATLTKPVNYGPSLTQLEGIRVPAVHDSGYSGAGVILAMFDTGFNKSHSATIQLKRIAERDFVWHDGETANQAVDVANQWDHGTGTWAVAGGYWASNLIGPAYNATFALAKTEYNPTETPVEEDNWVAGAEWSDSLGVDVISSSLAYLDFDGTADDYTWADLDGHTTVIAQAAVLAHRRGILVANAMGNEGPNGRTLWSPADVDSILSVGAVNSTNSIAIFSGRGNTADGRIKPEVVAQGVATYWAVASNNNSIAPTNGTSLSTPLVGGAAALVREAHPEWTVAQIRQAFMATADKAGAPDSVYGWGRIDTQLAIWGSAFGPPIYPRPFDLLVPTKNSTVTTTPVTLRWRRTTDPTPGDAVTYTVTVRSVTTNQVVYATTTPDSFAVMTGYMGPSTTYEWSVVATDLLGHGRATREPFRFTTGATTDVAIPPSPARVTLSANRPNPFLRVTDIPFTLEGSGALEPTSLRIFDSRGRLIRTLIDAPQPTARQYVIRWDGRTDTGTPAAAGVYHLQLRAAGRELTRRLVLLR